MLNVRLAIYLAIAAGVVGVYLYISHLRGEVEVLTAQLGAAQQQLEAVTEERTAVEERQRAAGRQMERLRADLAAARGRVETVVIPGDCPAALDWLATELKGSK